MAITLSGDNGITNVNGTAAAPAITGTDTDTGMYFGTNTVGVATNGVERVSFTANGGVSFGSSGTAYGTSGQFLQSNGDAAPTWVNAAAFASGTRLAFQQTAAPTGWTKDTTAGLNDSIMRIVTGSASSGGSTAFSTWAAVTSAGATTLAESQIPSHTHGLFYSSRNVSGTSTNITQVSAGTAYNSGATGGGGSHTHSLSQSLKYYDFIIASKD